MEIRQLSQLLKLRDSEASLHTHNFFVVQYSV